jgi:hypothetical protein
MAVQTILPNKNEKKTSQGSEILPHASQFIDKETAERHLKNVTGQLHLTLFGEKKRQEENVCHKRFSSRERQTMNTFPINVLI